VLGYRLVDGRLVPEHNPLERLDALVWIDLLDATAEQVAAVEHELAIDIPTRDEMAEIEISSRLYHERGAWFMTVTLPARASQDDAELAPVSFVLTERLLVTVRTTDPRAFRTFPQRAASADLELRDPATLLLALLEAIVDRLADILETAGTAIDAISSRIFVDRPLSAGSESAFRDVLLESGGS